MYLDVLSFCVWFSSDSLPGPGRRSKRVSKKDVARGDLKADDGVELNSERLGMSTGWGVDRA